MGYRLPGKHQLLHLFESKGLELAFASNGFTGGLRDRISGITAGSIVIRALVVIAIPFLIIVAPIATAVVVVIVAIITVTISPIIVAILAMIVALLATRLPVPTASLIFWLLGGIFRIKVPTRSLIRYTCQLGCSTPRDKRLTYHDSRILTISVSVSALVHRETPITRVLAFCVPTGWKP
jgi:hypothetical protein